MATAVRLRKEADEGRPPVVEILAEDFAGFVETYGGWVSSDGVFLPAELDLQTGSEVDCVCRMADGFELFGARCMVAWIRSQPDQLKRPAGVALHFLQMNESSRSFVDKMVENHRLAGGEPFDVDRERPRRQDEAAPDVRRLHTLMDQETRRRPQMESLGSGRANPVNELQTGQSFAPGLESSERSETNEENDRDSAALRAPVPRQVLDTLTGASSGGAGSDVPAAGGVEEPVSQVLDSGQIEPRVLARARAGPQPQGGEGRLPPRVSEASPKQPITSSPPAAPGRAPAGRVGQETRSPDGPRVQPSSRRGDAQPSRSSIDPLDRSRSPSSRRQHAEIEFSEAPRVDPLARRPSSPPTPKASAPVKATTAAASPAASAQAAARAARSSGSTAASEAPAADQLRLETELLDSTEVRARAARRRLRRWWVWAMALALAAAATWWSLAGPEVAWSLRGLLASREMPARGQDAATAQDGMAGELAQPATLLVGVSAEEIEGTTVVTLQFDGILDRARVSDLRLPSGRARHVFKITDISRPPTPEVYEVATKQVQRLRFGLHRIAGRPQVHIVADLADESVQLSGWQVLADRLVLRLR